MIATLAPRILNLPDDVRAALARVDGPGWEITRGAFLGGSYGPTETRPLARCGANVSDRYAWWPGNPAASVAAVLYPPGSPLHAYGLYHAHELLRVRLADNNDDHAAALSIIEAHVATRGPS